MDMHIRLVAAAILIAGISASSNATSIQYKRTRIVGSGIADLSITTDGIIGTVARSNIKDWDILVKNGGDTATLLGPFSGSNSGLAVVGSGLTASKVALSFNFSLPSYSYALFQKGFPGSSESYYCVETSGCGLRGESLLAAPNLFSGSVTSVAHSGVQVIAVADGVTFGSLLSGAVSQTVYGDTMTAKFTPNNGATLAEAAQIGGFDHFNWVQVAEEYPGGFLSGHPTPFLDPPAGGLGLQKADNLPFYWDEEALPGLDPSLSLASNIVGNTLEFFDAPSDIFVVPGVNEMKFLTTLVGIRSDNSWSPLYSFSWESDHTPLAGCPCVTRGLEHTPGPGGIFGVEEVLPSDIPAPVRAIWLANGLASVPEVPSWVTMIIGFGFVGAALRRHLERGRRRRVLSCPPCQTVV